MTDKTVSEVEPYSTTMTRYNTTVAITHGGTVKVSRLAACSANRI